MNPIEGLADRIRNETSDLEIVLDNIGNTWSELQSQPKNQDIYIDSTALRLHAVYTRLEKIFELISRVIDGTVPAGRTWHREILKNMSSDIAGSRPAVISAQTYTNLDELRRFRHLVRNVYTHNLGFAKMKPLV